MLHGRHDSQCGYCKHRIQNDESLDDRVHESYGVTFHDSKLTAEEYEELMRDRNFRRSGTYLYRPTNDA